MWFLLLAAAAFGQTTPSHTGSLTRESLQHPEVSAYRLRRYALARVPPSSVPADAAAWRARAAEIRRNLLAKIFDLAGEEQLKMEDAGYIAAGPGYRLRKLRYEAAPGMWIPALVYEPLAMRDSPAVLNLNGHEAEGKSKEYIQKRCIAQARHGIVAMNPEWIGMGELAHPENSHWFQAHLDAAGQNGAALFYRAMRRALDLLEAMPGVDKKRIGVTGLSGGGWQSLVLAALDERIAVAVPNAGYLSARHFGAGEWIGDNEQSPADFHSIADYSHLTAMLAPRPTLLIYNETDDCCFRAPRMKPFLFDPVAPVFGLFGARDMFGWHGNTDPGDHNYQLENRLVSLRFFSRAFGLPEPVREEPAGGSIKSDAELRVGVPADNLTILGLARRLAARRTGSGGRLSEVVRYAPVRMEDAWPMTNFYSAGVRSVGYRFDFDDGLAASGYLIGEAAGGEQRPWTILIGDKGGRGLGAPGSDRVNRGEYALLADPLLFGDAAPASRAYPVFDRMLTTLGSRPLGIQAAQTIAMARWLGARTGHRAGGLESHGMRSQAVALVAAALAPELFSRVDTRDGLRSWRELFDKPVRYEDAPELFCPGLFAAFDIDTLARR